MTKYKWKSKFDFVSFQFTQWRRYLRRFQYDFEHLNYALADCTAKPLKRSVLSALVATLPLLTKLILSKDSKWVFNIARSYTCTILTIFRLIKKAVSFSVIVLTQECYGWQETITLRRFLSVLQKLNRPLPIADCNLGIFIANKYFNLSFVVFPSNSSAHMSINDFDSDPMRLWNRFPRSQLARAAFGEPPEKTYCHWELGIFFSEYRDPYR